VSDAAQEEGDTDTASCIGSEEQEDTQEEGDTASCIGSEEQEDSRTCASCE